MSDEATPDGVAPVIEQPRDEAGRFAEPEVQAEPTEATEGEEPEVAETDGEAQENDDLPHQKKRGKTAEDRINDLTRKFREMERRNQVLEGLVSQPTPGSASEGAAKPTPEQFESYDEYVDALTDWKVDQKLNKSSAETAKRTESSLQQANWAVKLEAAQSTLPDYAEVVGSSEVPILQHVAQALMDADRGPELAYHMAQNPEVAERLNKMSPMKAALELGRLETALAAPVAKQTTNAPAPATPIRTTSARQSDPAKMSMDEYVEYRRKQGAGY